MKKRRITDEELASLVTYDPRTGRLLWNFRDRSLYEKESNWARFNREMVGAEAFTATDNHGYKKAIIFGHCYKAHRVAWLVFHGKLPEGQLDHINGVRDDNRIENLRVASNEENHRNMKISARNTSGATGVFWDKRRAKWRASIRAGGKSICLGLHKTIEDARVARSAAEARYGYHTNHGMTAEARASL